MIITSSEQDDSIVLDSLLGLIEQDHIFNLLKTEYSVVFCNKNEDFVQNLVNTFSIQKLYPLTLFLYDPIGSFTSNKNLIIGKFEGLIDSQSISDTILNCISSKVSFYTKLE